VLDNLQALVNHQTRGNNNNNNNNNMPMMMEPGANIRVPYILADQMVDLSFLDRFKDDFLEFLKFDDQACCAQVPEADETVFVSIHYLVMAHSKSFFSCISHEYICIAPPSAAAPLVIISALS
jgi:hypothetical protein